MNATNIFNLTKRRVLGQLVLPALIAAFPTTALAQGACGSATTVSSLPYTFNGDLFGGVNNFEPGAGCVAVFAAPGPDALFKYTTGPAAQTVTIVMTPQVPIVDAVLYVATVCGSVVPTCVAGSDQAAAGAPETIPSLALASNTTYYVFADTSFNGGAYSLKMDAAVLPCQTAVNVASVPYTKTNATTATATPDFAPYPCGGIPLPPNDRDVVYRFTPAVATSVNFRVVPTNAAFDPIAYIFTNCQQQPRCVAAADVVKPGFRESLVNVPLQAGVDYFFAVDSFATSGGYNAFIETATSPCAAAVSVPLPLPTTQTGTTAGALNSFDPVFGCTGTIFAEPGPDKAYLLQLPAAGFVSAEVTPALQFDADIYLLTDCANQTVSCTDFSGSTGAGQKERIFFYAQANKPYYIVVDSPVGQGSFSLRIQQEANPCVSALAVAALPYSHSGNTGLKTNSVNDQSHCTGLYQPGRDELYGFTPAADMQITATVTPDPTYDASLYIFTSCSDAGGTCIAGIDQGISGDTETLTCVSLKAGVKYYFAVDSAYPSSVGPYTLDISAVAPGGCPVYKCFAPFAAK